MSYKLSRKECFLLVLLQKLSNRFEASVTPLMYNYIGAVTCDGPKLRTSVGLDQHQGVTDCVPPMHVRSRTYMKQQCGTGDDLLTGLADRVIWRDRSWRVTCDALLISSPLPSSDEAPRRSDVPPIHSLFVFQQISIHLCLPYSLWIKAASLAP